MSHNLQFKTKIQDATLLKAACESLRKQGMKVEGPTQEVTGRRRERVKMPDWYYSMFFHCDKAGTVDVDSDDRSRNHTRDLNRLSSTYVEESYKAVAAAQGEFITGQVVNEDGSIDLIINHV